MANAVASAVYRALHTVELVENVLQHCIYEDLIRCMRVSKHFNAVITGSLALGRVLWRDVPNIKVVEIDYDELGNQLWSRPKYHPLLAHGAHKLEIDNMSASFASDPECADESFRIYFEMDYVMLKPFFNNGFPRIWKRMPFTIPAFPRRLKASEGYECPECGRSLRTPLTTEYDTPRTLWDFMSILELECSGERDLGFETTWWEAHKRDFHQEIHKVVVPQDECLKAHLFEIPNPEVFLHFELQQPISW
jgi:hypothetical protein